MASDPAQEASVCLEAHPLGSSPLHYWSCQFGAPISDSKSFLMRVRVAIGGQTQPPVSVSHSAASLPCNLDLGPCQSLEAKARKKPALRLLKGVVQGSGPTFLSALVQCKI